MGERLSLIHCGMYAVPLLNTLSYSQVVAVVIPGLGPAAVAAAAAVTGSAAAVAELPSGAASDTEPHPFATAESAELSATGKVLEQSSIITSREWERESKSESVRGSEGE